MKDFNQKKQMMMMMILKLMFRCSRNLHHQQILTHLMAP